MIIAPAYAPTDVDASPEASSPMAKSRATVRPERVAHGGVRAFDGVGVVAALQIGRGDQHHRQVDRTGDQHRQPDVASRVTRSSQLRCGPASGWPCRSRARPECR